MFTIQSIYLLKKKNSGFALQPQKKFGMLTNYLFRADDKKCLITGKKKLQQAIRYEFANKLTSVDLQLLKVIIVQFVTQQIFTLAFTFTIYSNHNERKLV